MRPEACDRIGRNSTRISNGLLTESLPSTGLRLTEGSVHVLVTLRSDTLGANNVRESCRHRRL
jgi:hypothetical protein